MQARYGDVKQYQAERPPVTQLDQQLKWDYWVKVDGMSREEARRLWLEAAIPIMEREGISSEHPEKALVDKKYNDCIKLKMASG